MAPTEITVMPRSATLASRPCNAVWSVTSPRKVVVPSSLRMRDIVEPGRPVLVEVSLDSELVGGGRVESSVHREPTGSGEVRAGRARRMERRRITHLATAVLMTQPELTERAVLRTLIPTRPSPRTPGQATASDVSFTAAAGAWGRSQATASRAPSAAMPAAPSSPAEKPSVWATASPTWSAPKADGDRGHQRPGPSAEPTW